jgi:PAS domain S-box-containing protein
VETLTVLPVIVWGLLGVVNHLSGVPPDDALSAYSALPVNTSVGLLALAVGVLAARGATSGLALLRNPSTGGRMARRLLPWVALGPLAVGLAINEGSRAGYYSHLFGDVLLSALTIVLVGGVVWLSASAADRADLARVKTTAELAVAEDRYRRFFDESPVALYRTAPDGRILDANFALASLLGYQSPRELVGVSATAHHVDPTRRDAFRLVLDQARVLQGHRVELRHRDGTTFWAADTSAAVLGPDGRILHYEGCLIDVTEQRAAEERVAASERRFRALIEQSSDGIALLDGQGCVRYASPAAERMLGLSIDAWTGISYEELVHPEDLADARSGFAAALADGATSVRRAVRLRHADGGWRRIEGIMLNRLDDPDVGGMIVNFRDVTELREAEERFVQAQRMEAVGQLAGGVAHDFNNLLTVMMASADLLRSHHREGSEDHELADEIRQAAESAAALTRQLLFFSRRQLAVPEAVRFDETVENAIALLRRTIGEDIELDVRLASRDAWVMIGHGTLQQVVTNLAVNARDAMPSGGRLLIQSARTPDDSGVTLTVTDTGVGMPSDVAAHAFEPFFTTKGIGHGTGLGLATCHGIVRQAGGEITLESAPGIGTTVRIVLPRVPAPGAQDAGTETPLPGAGETVLVVEDDSAVRRITQRALTDAGYHVVSARDAEEALEVIREPGTRIDLLLSDVVLPGLGGRALSEAARKLRPDLRVLFASGYTDDVILRRQLLAHDVEVLQKPFTPRELTARVRAALDRPPHARPAD